MLDVCCGTGTIGISLAKVRRLLLKIHKNMSNEQSNIKNNCVLTESEEGDWHRVVPGGSGRR